MLQNNCLYNNLGGNYKNCTSTTDIYVNPLFADQKNHDYHLQSAAGRWNGKNWVKDKVSSPCIDAGYPFSDYSNEPEPNGNRINIGPDGNTRYASKSELYVSTPILPIANFSSNINSGYAPLSVQFTDLSKNVTGINWNFGDRITSIDQNPTHTYSTAGNYTVNLTVSNANGTDSKTATINVLEKSKPILPVANFSTNVTRGSAPLSIRFTDLSQNTISWSWDFDNNGQPEFSNKNPVYVYTVPGVYTVNLTAINENGTTSKLTTINVTEGSENNSGNSGSTGNDTTSGPRARRHRLRGGQRLGGGRRRRHPRGRLGAGNRGAGRNHPAGRVRGPHVQPRSAGRVGALPARAAPRAGAARGPGHRRRDPLQQPAHRRHRLLAQGRHAPQGHAGEPGLATRSSRPRRWAWRASSSWGAGSPGSTRSPTGRARWGSSSARASSRTSPPASRTWPTAASSPAEEIDRVLREWVTA